jgi:16S rRNA processing protein RimM
MISFPAMHHFPAVVMFRCLIQSINLKMEVLSFPVTATRSRVVSMSSTGDSMTAEGTERRKHKNKYSKFATEKVDPLEAAMRKSDENQLKEKNTAESFNPVRGTTVPMKFKSNATKNMPEKTSVTFDDSGVPLPITPIVNIFFQNQNAIIPSDPFTFGYTQIGTIGSPHGVKGELKVTMDTDFAADRLQQGLYLHVKRPNRLTPRPIRIESGRKQAGNTYLVKFDCVNSRLGAAAFKGYGAFVRLNNRPVLAVDEYPVRDIVDMNCYIEVPASNKGGKTISKRSELVGQVIGVVPPDELCDPAMAKLMHAMLEIRLSGTEDKLCLIPLVPSIVTSVNTATMRIVIDPPSGLLDFTYIEKKKKIVIRGFLPEKAAHLSKEDRRYLNKVSVLQFPNK